MTKHIAKTTVRNISTDQTTTRERASDASCRGPTEKKIASTSHFLFPSPAEEKLALNKQNAVSVVRSQPFVKRWAAVREKPPCFRVKNYACLRGENALHFSQLVGLTILSLLCGDECSSTQCRCHPVPVLEDTRTIGCRLSIRELLATWPPPNTCDTALYCQPDPISVNFEHTASSLMLVVKKTPAWVLFFSPLV